VRFKITAAEVTKQKLVLYTIQVQTAELYWHFQARYKDLLVFSEKINKLCFKPLLFPPKKMFGNLDISFISERARDI
jgi:hypothetical protein